MATDIAQEVFMKLWEKKMTIKNENIKALLFKMASDLFVSHYRKQMLALKYMNTLPLENVSSSTEEDIHYRELKKNYEIKLAELPEKQRVVFLMSRIDGLKYPEIANNLKLSIKAVEKRMGLALKFLRKELNK